MRLFTALALPGTVADALMGIMGGVPGARWQSREQLHLTLRFIGEADGAEAEDIHEALQTISAPEFDLEISSVGVFGGDRPRSLWAGTETSQPLMHLNRKIESALQRAGCEADRRRFSPHITLARLKGPDPARLGEYLSRHALFHAGHFTVKEFVLFSSQLTPNGSIYRPEARYALSCA